MEPNYCYIIHDRHGFTYNGYCVKPERRIRQHNREIVGGAKYTTRRSAKSGDPDHWKYLLWVESPQFTRNTALSLEWSVKYPTNRRPRPRLYDGPEGRIRSLPLVFNNPKFGGFDFTVRACDPAYYTLIREVLSGLGNVTITYGPEKSDIHIRGAVPGTIDPPNGGTIQQQQQDAQSPQHQAGAQAGASTGSQGAGRQEGRH